MSSSFDWKASHAQQTRRLVRALAALREINELIYAKGAPLGSREYFAIRKLAAEGQTQEDES